MQKKRLSKMLLSLLLTLALCLSGVGAWNPDSSAQSVQPEQKSESSTVQPSAFVPGVISSRQMAKEGAPAPSNIKIKCKKKKGGKVKVTVSWSGSAAHHLIVVRDYYAGGYNEQWNYTSAHSKSFVYPVEEGIPHKFWVYLYGHSGSNRSDNSTYSKEIRKSKKFQYVGPQTLKVIQILSDNGVYGMDTFNQIRFAHDWIVKNYDYSDSGGNACHTFPGTFKNRSGVCEGYAKTFLTFMTCLGIPVDYVHNKKHGWNMVKLNGAWYHLDATYDDPTGAMESTTSQYPIYDYFLQSTSNLKQKSGANAHAYAENEWQKATSTIYDNDGDKSGYSEDMPDGMGTCSSTFTPWMNGQPLE